MEDRVRFALEKLLNVAHVDTGQGRRVVNFLLAWWNAEVHGGFDITDLANVDPHIGAMATVSPISRARRISSTPPTIARKSRRSSSAGVRRRKRRDGKRACRPTVLSPTDARKCLNTWSDALNHWERR